MRPPIAHSPGRVHQSLATGALSPHEAAVRLARVEFDVARLERELAVAANRVEKAQRLLARHSADRDVLLSIISREAKPPSKKVKTNAT